MYEDATPILSFSEKPKATRITKRMMKRIQWPTTNLPMPLINLEKKPLLTFSPALFPKGGRRVSILGRYVVERRAQNTTPMDTETPKDTSPSSGLRDRTTKPDTVVIEPTIMVVNTLFVALNPELLTSRGLDTYALMTCME